MLDVLFGGRVVAGMPLGTAMTRLRLRPDAGDATEKYHGRMTSSSKPDRAGALIWNGSTTSCATSTSGASCAGPSAVWVPGGSSEPGSGCATWTTCTAPQPPAIRPRTIDTHELVDAAEEHNPYRVGMTQAVFVADNESQAEDYPRPSPTSTRMLHIYRGFTDAPGYRREGDCPAWPRRASRARTAAWRHL